MDSITFTFFYLFIGLVVLVGVWVSTSPFRKLVGEFPLRNTALLQVSINLIHVVSGVFFPLPIYFDIPVRSLGLTIFTVGLVVACSAKIIMKENWGVPGIHDVTTQKNLVIRGPFSYSRNPIYLGIILISFGLSIALKSTFIFLIFILYNHFFAQVKKEEKNLEKIFGNEYRTYCIHVPRFI